MQKNAARQRFGFRLADGDVEQGAVSCETRAERHSVDLKVVEIDRGADIGLTCSLAGPDAPDAAGDGSGAGDWILSLVSTRDRHLEGQLSTAARRFEVRGTGRGGKITPADTHGFHLLSDGRVVAAVQTRARATVWLAPELDAEARRIVALGAVALLLYQEPPTDS